jgi:hypothetical protein
MGYGQDRCLVGLGNRVGVSMAQVAEQVVVV